jgi:hypothetical protein
MNRIIQHLASLDGAQIPGGCDHCNAYQGPSVDAYGIGHITIHHDDCCPWFQAREGKRQPPTPFHKEQR